MSDLRYHLDLIRWKDYNGVTKKLKIYSEVAHKWNEIATRLGFEPGKIVSLRNNFPTDHDRVMDVFRHWLENAGDLPNAGDYPRSWCGLVKLLKDVELSELAKQLHTALCSTHNSVRGNLK